MERLTYWCDDGMGGGEYRVNENGAEYSGHFIDRLATYEDTGLEPQTISEILDSVSEWYDAHKEGRLVVLPCKVGDTLYEIDLPEDGVIVCKVMWMILKNDVSVQVEVTDGHGLGSGYCFELGDFGRTVFHTREAAEAALKEREGK